MNSDWGTMAYSFTRDDLQGKFKDPEIRHNAIYFLFGDEYRNNVRQEVVYVGQAAFRDDEKEAALARLREHDESTTESYRDKWNKVVVVVNKNKVDEWNLADLSALEHIFINEIPNANRLNGRQQNCGGADLSAYRDKVDQIKALITATGHKIFEDVTEKTPFQVINDIYESNLTTDIQGGESRIPEYTTPSKVVKAMVDMLPASVWNSNTKFLDPACKGGEFLREIYERLMENETMQSEFQDPITRSNHILRHQIYGIALSKASLDRTTNRLFGEDRNLRIIPDYIRKLRGVNMGIRPDGKQNNIRDILNKEFGEDMNIDVVIGNPPYQEDTGGGIMEAGHYIISL